MLIKKVEYAYYITFYQSRMIIKERNPTYDEYKTLREAVGWWSTEDKSTKTALKNALYSVVALHNGAVIGIGRIIGDRGLYYYIQDLIVHPDYQRKGSGTRLMTKCLRFANTITYFHHYNLCNCSLST